MEIISHGRCSPKMRSLRRSPYQQFGFFYRDDFLPVAWEIPQFFDEKKLILFSSKVSSESVGRLSG
jgi:hypothetical protein